MNFRERCRALRELGRRLPAAETGKHTKKRPAARPAAVAEAAPIPPQAPSPFAHFSDDSLGVEIGRLDRFVRMAIRQHNPGAQMQYGRLLGAARAEYARRHPA